MAEGSVVVVEEGVLAVDGVGVGVTADEAESTIFQASTTQTKPSASSKRSLNFGDNFQGEV